MTIAFGWSGAQDSKSASDPGAGELTHMRVDKRKPVIGLAGGIGAGKTAVARILASLGGRVLDFDRLAHEELGKPDVIDTLRRWWGQVVDSPDGTVDRKAVASIVFDDPGELQRLEDLLYPRLRRYCESWLAGSYEDGEIQAMVLDAPKLFEAGLDRLCDAVIFVDADEAVRVQRVAKERGWGEEELKRRENLQKPLDMKKANADHVVINHAGTDELQMQVERVYSSVLESFTM